MANQEHLDILKHGVDVWNEWREENRIYFGNIRPDLNGVDLHGVDLKGVKLTTADLKGVKLAAADLSRADLSETNLWGADCREAKLEDANLFLANLNRAVLTEVNLRGAVLIEAVLTEVDLRGADLRGVDLSGADLSGADLYRAKLGEADLYDANLSAANLQRTDLRGANLEQAILSAVNLTEANLQETNFSESKLGNTIFVQNDLSGTLNLKECTHLGPSILHSSTLIESGKLPIEFLRSCGLTDWEIESIKLYQPNLSNEEIININYKIIDLRTTQAIQINPLFISYSRPDGEFVDTVGDKLTEKGIRYWRDIHHATAGRLEKQVDRAMRLHPTVLLVLSKHSTNSDWVEHEVKKARKLEKELGKDVICPVALDNSWENCNWPERLKEQIIEYNIMDFGDWKDGSKFEDNFSKLLQGLDLFYK